MEGRYIFAIVILAVFFLLIFVSFVILERGRIKDDRLQAWIRDQYSSKEVNKYDYDSNEDPETPIQKAETVANETEEIEEAIPDEPIENPYGKIDIEGIEEITGNYNGDK